MTYYAYIHCKPDGTPFYVGKGVRARYKNFTQRSEWHKRVTAKYGPENILIGKLSCTTNAAALELEVGLIKCFRKMSVTLVNKTEGGEGNVGWRCPDSVRIAVASANKQRVFTDALRYKLGASFRGKKRPEHSALMKSREAFLGDKNIFYGMGHLQVGRLNHMARPVCGAHISGKQRQWETLTDAAKELGVSIQAVCQAIKKKGRSKGWKLEHLNGL